MKNYNKFYKNLAKERGFDSEEEAIFYDWCCEAKDNKIIDKFGYSQERYLLIGKQVDNHGKHIYRSVSYTDDFQINGIFEFYQSVKNFFKNPKVGVYVIDVKGGETEKEIENYRSFQIRRKLMYSVHGIYVNILVPDLLFAETFVPESRFKYTEKTMDIRKKYKKMKTVNQFMEGIKCHSTKINSKS
ncbi:MAG: hypothetical protein GY870_10115 [archaeon]|nr:hypothetical protein [archaeon]